MSEVLLNEENLIDLSSENLSSNFLFELTNIIEKKGLQKKSVKINFGDINLSKSRLENIISVLKGFYIDLIMVYANSKMTQIAAIESGLTVSGQTAECIEQVSQEEQASQANLDENAYTGEDIEDATLEGLLWQETNSESEQKETFYIKQTLRSGQKIEKDGNIVIIGDCNAGSEIIASGDIIVWGVLSGLAHAGSKGDKQACIRAFKINAIQLRITDLLARKPDKIEIDKVGKPERFNPEEAKISNEEIVIYSLYQENN
ncbi:MAG TPA: septum site-determining protein MinC [Candidatus Gastranaerophilales bacterium]|nr:septum site-determining protein MinC [Candidatus Gastranaerophilales bacterium]